jgi:hypothetical protein
MLGFECLPCDSTGVLVRFIEDVGDYFSASADPTIKKVCWYCGGTGAQLPTWMRQTDLHRWLDETKAKA